MRQCDQVDAVVGKGQRIELAEEPHRIFGRLRRDETVARRRQGQRFGHHQRVAHDPAVRHAVGAKAVELGHAELQRVETEGVGDGLVETVLFPLEQVASRRGLQPKAQLYNRLVSRHDESNPPARL